MRKQASRALFIARILKLGILLRPELSCSVFSGFLAPFPAAALAPSRFRFGRDNTVVKALLTAKHAASIGGVQMAMASTSCSVESIGETAGIIWHTLNENGPLTITKLIDEAGAPKDLAMLALGWLAREGKITIEESGRKKMVNLRD
jgi:hypothetical protein